MKWRISKLSSLKLNIKNETAPLEAVVLGLAKSPGPIPKLSEAYDPKSIEHIKAGTYPTESAMMAEMAEFLDVFNKYGVKVYRPEMIENCNQIFSRDISFVIDDLFIKSNILPRREDELAAIQYIIDEIDPNKIIFPPKEVHVEGGDVMVWNNYLFVGTYYGKDYPDYITARTNPEAVEFLTDLFPDKQVLPFSLVKSNTQAKKNALHLDCCFQPVGKDKAIIHREGFQNQKDVDFLIDFFGEDNIFQITADQMYNMWSNVFSIAPDVVVSEVNFTGLNNWLREKGITVEEIHYAEIAKQEGLLRCSTLPLRRKND